MSNRYIVDERDGIIGVIDIQHKDYDNRGNCLQSDYPWVVANWDGERSGKAGYWELKGWQVKKAKNLCDLLNSYPEASEDLTSSYRTAKEEWGKWQQIAYDRQKLALELCEIVKVFLKGFGIVREFLHKEKIARFKDIETELTTNA